MPRRTQKVYLRRPRPHKSPRHARSGSHRTTRTRRARSRSHFFYTGSVYATVAKAAVQHNITGRFLLETPPNSSKICRGAGARPWRRSRRARGETRSPEAAGRASPPVGARRTPRAKMPRLWRDHACAEAGRFISRFFGERSLDGPRVEDLRQPPAGRRRSRPTRGLFG